MELTDYSDRTVAGAAKSGNLLIERPGESIEKERGASVGIGLAGKIDPVAFSRRQPHLPPGALRRSGSFEILSRDSEMQSNKPELFGGFGDNSRTVGCCSCIGQGGLQSAEIEM